MIYRVEDKYIPSPEKMAELEHRVRLVLPLDPHIGGKGFYTISSLYFDDIRDTCYFDSLNGNPERDKFRIRIYDGKTDLIKLEVKRKKYNRAYKISSTITAAELEMLKAGECIGESSAPEGMAGHIGESSAPEEMTGHIGESNSPEGMAGHIGESSTPEGKAVHTPEQAVGQDARRLFNMAIKQKGLRPRVIVTYERTAFAGEDGNVRITFDRNIRASRNIDTFGTTIYGTIKSWEDIDRTRQCETDRPDRDGINGDIVRPDDALWYEPVQDRIYGEMGYVLEVKYDQFLPHYIAQILETGSMIQTANSKYALCRQALE